jgi:CRISPR-associated protein Csm2
MAYSQSNYGAGHQQNRRQHEQPEMTRSFEASWIKEKLNSGSIDFAEEFGGYLKETKFTTSQIRNVFGEVKRIQLKGFEDNKTSFLLLRPKLAYAAKRANTKGAEAFEKVMQQAHMAVDADQEGSGKRFLNFCDFMEAVLAYHKAKGGN